MSFSAVQAAKMIGDFCIGAVMQQDPFLEEFGTPPEEPPDKCQCWDAAENGEVEQPALEQGMLFDFHAPEPKGVSRAAHPTAKTKPIEVKAIALTKPYEPHHIPYRQWLDIFYGDSTLALFYFGNQAMKD